MPDDLERIFGELAAQVPTAPEESFQFSANSLPVPPVHLLTDRLFIGKGKHMYGGSYRVDSLWFHADYAAFRYLALLILSAMFHEHSSPIRLDLLHDESDIKHLMIEYNFTNFAWRGLYVPRPHTLQYVALAYEETRGFSASGPLNPLHLEDRPRFRLSNLKDEVFGEEDYANRDTVWLSGNDRANALLADFLLDIGRPDEPYGIYDIEGSGEEGSVLGQWSAEVRFILPGHS